jgi:RsiW-degrading membrane proteinase PrsW (M82 family)
MGEDVCCICHEPAGPACKRLGGRSYCERHFAKVTHERPGAWRAGLWLILGQLAFVALVIALVSLLQPSLEGWMLAVTGIALAIIPAFLWLALFYGQDRLEPEPKSYVAKVFLLGALLAQAVGIPLVRDVFDVGAWLPTDLWVSALGSILVVGFIQEFLKYAAVRYSIYGSPEFDERSDGIVYGTAAGLGYATVLNLHYVLQSGGVNLEAGVIRVVVTALAQASFAGLTGYFLGRAKFEDRPVWWLGAGVALAAVLNGLFTTLRGELTTTALGLEGGGFNPWPGLALAAVVAGLTLAALFYLLRRANRLTLSGAEASAE